MVLAHELAHIVLGHNLGSQYAFNDRMLFSTKRRTRTSDSNTSRRGSRRRQESHRDAEGIALRAEIGKRGTFHQGFAGPHPQLTALLQAHLGNSFTENGTVTRMAALAHLGSGARYQ